MVRKLVIPLFIVALGALSTELTAATSQCVRFPAPAPPAADPGTDDLRVGVKADGVPNINSGPIDLDASPADPPELIARRAGKAVCLDAFNKPGATCTRDLPAAACSGTACCSAFDVAQTVIFHCVNASGNGFELSRTLGEPFTVGIGGVPGGVGNVSHLTSDNKGIYTDLILDIAPRALIQIRPGGVTGVIQLIVKKGATTSSANLTVDASNNDPSEGLQLATAIVTAFGNVSPALNPPIVATVHTLQEATQPLTGFGYLKQGTHFVEISNIAAAGITELEVRVQPGQAFTIEGSTNSIDSTVPSVPTLSTWGIVVLVIMLLLSGYVLMRRQTAGTATT